MKIKTFLRATFPFIGIVMLFGCSTTSKFGQGDSVQTHKVRDLDEIEEVSFENKMKANYNQVYYYPFDSSDLTDEDIQSIKVQAKYLKEHPGSKVIVAGHTDSRGSAEYNMGLGFRRSKSVVSILRNIGVSRAQIKYVSFGEEKPAVLGDTEAAYKWNRRAELTYRDF